MIELIRPLATVNVRGNHDRVCCGLTSSLGFNPMARGGGACGRSEQLTPENLAWLRALPQGPLQPELAGR